MPPKARANQSRPPLHAPAAGYCSADDEEGPSSQQILDNMGKNRNNKRGSNQKSLTTEGKPNDAKGCDQTSRNKEEGDLSRDVTGETEPSDQTLSNDKSGVSTERKREKTGPRGTLASRNPALGPRGGLDLQSWKSWAIILFPALLLVLSAVMSGCSLYLVCNQRTSVAPAPKAVESFLTKAQVLAIVDERLTEQNEKWETDYETSPKNLDQLRNDITAQFSETSQRADALEGEATVNKLQLKSMEQKYNNLANEVLELRGKVEVNHVELSQKIRNLQQEREDKRKEDQNRLKEYKERCAEAETKCVEETSKLKEELLKQRQTIDKQGDKAKVLTFDVDENRFQINTLKGQFTKTLSNLEGQIIATVQRTTTDITSIKIQVEEVGKKVDSSTRQIKYLSDKLGDTEKNLSEQGEDIRELDRKLILTSDTVWTIRAGNERMKNVSMSLKNQHNEAQAVSHRLILLETANRTLVHDLIALKSDFNKTKMNVTGEYHRCKTTVQELKEGISVVTFVDRSTKHLIGTGYSAIGPIFISLTCFIIWAEYRRRKLCAIIHAE